MPAFGLVWVWLTPGILYSTGSSIVEMLTSGVFRIDRTLNSVVDLPEPVGPVTSNMPLGSLIDFSIISSDLPHNPSCFKVKAFEPSPKIRMTTFSPSATGSVDTRKAN